MMAHETSGRPVMLSLISEQAIPNVMAALLVDPHPRAVVCLLPEDKEHSGTADREFLVVFSGIQSALGRIDSSIQVINWAAEGDGHPVSPYDAGAVRQACQSIRRDGRFAAGPWIYNITGGTKVMAQAALDDAREHGHPAIYVDTESRRLIWDQKGALDFDEHRLQSIGVEEYLAAYGVEVNDYEDNLDGDLRQTARLLCQNPDGPSLIKKIKGCKNPAQDMQVVRRFGPGDLSQSERALLFEVARTLFERDVEIQELDGSVELTVWTTDEEVRAFFWGGRWLESYVFDTICQLHNTGGPWHYTSPWRNVLLKWSGIEFSGLEDEDPGADVLVRPTNELDVAAARGARLLICECKTGSNALKSKNLYTLQVVGHKLGTFAGKVFITDRHDLRNPSNPGTRHGVVRALTLGIAVVEASQLPALDRVLADPEKELRKQKRSFGLAA